VGVASLGVLVAVLVGAPIGAGSPPLPGLAAATIPAAYLADYQAAAASCPGLDWTVLAAVGTVESGNGAHPGPSTAGAEGPMQFLPATFAAYNHPVPADPATTPIPPGTVPPSPWDRTDAIWAAARYLCSLGAGRDPRSALVAYNCGNPGPACQRASARYAAAVLAVAARFGAAGSLDGSIATQVVGYARSQLGVPYRWGDENPGGAFDCSGLTQWAWAQVGMALPRTAQSQYDTGPAVPPDQSLAPGDLVYFGPQPTQVTHVGIVIDPAGAMIDAPHTGAAVRVDRFIPTEGAPFGADHYLGATRP
jgi:cell wall-associated NlpC family hydrolase